MTEVAHKIRKAETKDHNFILSSWIRSYRTSPERRLVNPGYYYDKQEQQCRRLLADSDAAVMHVEDDEDALYGWACGRKGMLHYVYVKSWARRLGIATELVESVCGGLDPLVVTCYTVKGRRILERHPEIILDPWSC